MSLGCNPGILPPIILPSGVRRRAWISSATRRFPRVRCSCRTGLDAPRNDCEEAGRGSCRSIRRFAFSGDSVRSGWDTGLLTANVFNEQDSKNYDDIFCSRKYLENTECCQF